MTDEENPQDRRNGAPEGLSRLAQIAGKIIAPVTAITALMVYFGWALTSATYGVFGIEDSVLEFSIQDYLLRSINETVKPVVLLLLVVLVAIPIHLGLIKLIRDHGWRRRVIFPLGAVGAVSVLAGLLGFLDVVTYPVAWPLIPMSLGLGALLIGYANSLWRAAIGTQLSPIGGSDVIDIVTRVSFTAFLVITLFWSLANYARIHGVENAQKIAQRVGSLTSVVVFSPHSLHFDSGGIRETVLIGDQNSRYYRYDGLRLLLRANNKYILLPWNWQPGMRTIVLSDDPTIRMEFYLGDR
jgi:hypothetical protein